MNASDLPGDGCRWVRGVLCSGVLCLPIRREWQKRSWKCVQDQAEPIFYLAIIKYTSAGVSELGRLVSAARDCLVWWKERDRPVRPGTGV